VKEVVGGERWLIGEEVDKRDVLSKRGKSQVKSPNDCAETSSGRDEWMLVEVLDSGLGEGADHTQRSCDPDPRQRDWGGSADESNEAD